MHLHRINSSAEILKYQSTLPKKFRYSTFHFLIVIIQIFSFSKNYCQCKLNQKIESTGNSWESNFNIHLKLFDFSTHNKMIDGKIVYKVFHFIKQVFAFSSFKVDFLLKCLRILSIVSLQMLHKFYKFNWHSNLNEEIVTNLLFLT